MFRGSIVSGGTGFYHFYTKSASSVSANGLSFALLFVTGHDPYSITKTKKQKL